MKEVLEKANMALGILDDIDSIRKGMSADASPLQSFDGLISMIQLGKDLNKNLILGTFLGGIADGLKTVSSTLEQIDERAFEAGIVQLQSAGCSGMKQIFVNGNNQAFWGKVIGALNGK